MLIENSGQVSFVMPVRCMLSNRYLRTPAAMLSRLALRAVKRAISASIAGLCASAAASGLAVAGELALFCGALEQLRLTQNYQPMVLAITGTNGKTTVTALTGLLVARAGKTVAVAGNIGPTLLDTLPERRCHRSGSSNCPVSSWPMQSARWAAAACWRRWSPRQAVC